MSGYIIITPAHNEEAHIGRTAESVINQTMRPMKWIVVDDNSTDHTREFARIYAEQYPFVEVVSITRPAGRHFANKVNAFNVGVERIRQLNYSYIGNLDADISFGCDYFENVLSRFQAYSTLGIAGGMVQTLVAGRFASQNVALDSVAGAVQLFRRECFEQIGGYRAMPNGGIDAAAEIAARMHGWETRTFPELTVTEHRTTGSATAGPITRRVREGRRMHSLGYSPSFFVLRGLYRIMDRPAAIGTCAALYGFFSNLLRGVPLAVPSEVAQFLRKEQHAKLKQWLGAKGMKR